MKRLLKAFCWWLMVAVVLYGVAIAVAAPVNPMDWSETQRAVFLAISVALAFVLGVEFYE